MGRLKFLLIVFFSLSMAVVAQTPERGLLQHCKSRTDAAWQFAGDAARELQFNNGANSFDEVRNHCFEALISLDSLDLALQQAIYSASDAASELKSTGGNQTFAGVEKLKSDLKQALAFLEATKPKLQAVLDETNVDAINQKLFDTVENLDSCRQHLKRAQTTLKSLLK